VFFEWHTSFKEGREDVKDDERTGHPKTHWADENVEKVQKLVRSDRRLSVRMMAEELNLDRETVRQILTEDLGTRKVSAKMVPRILSDDQKQQRLDVCSDLSRQLAEGKNFLDRVIMDDESWCFQYNPETKHQSMQWKTSVSPRPKKKAHLLRDQVKILLICFFDHKDIVHFEFLEQGRTVNQYCYLEILARLHEAVHRRRPELRPDAWILHHDSAPAHDALAFWEFLAKKSIL
jgi:hypothetical protein